MPVCQALRAAHANRARGNGWDPRVDSSLSTKPDLLPEPLVFGVVGPAFLERLDSIFARALVPVEAVVLRVISQS